MHLTPLDTGCLLSDIKAVFSYNVREEIFILHHGYSENNYAMNVAVSFSGFLWLDVGLSNYSSYCTNQFSK